MKFHLLSTICLAATLATGATQAVETFDLGGAAKGDPSAVTYKFGGKDAVAVFVRGPGDLMYANVGDASGASWTGWAPIGDEALKGSPACTAITPSFIDCVAVGKNNAVYQIRYSAKAHEWSDWQSLGGFATGAPGIAKAFDGDGNPYLAVYVSGPDNQLFSNSRIDGEWTEWEPLGITVGGDVACTDILKVGDHCYDTSSGSAVQLTDVTMEANDSISTDDLGGAVTHKVSAVATGAKGNTLRIFVNGPGQRIWMKKWSGTWSEWEQLPALAGTNAPGCTIPSTGDAFCAINEAGTVKVNKLDAGEI
jgi:hypothetical protein